jgi:glycosyltransferase involved in cell wall biosynthesis
VFLAPGLLEWLGMPQPERVRLAFLLSSFAAGGTEHQMIELIRRLDRGRFESHVACFHKQGPWLPRLAEAAASIVEFPLRSFRSPSTIRQARAFARWCREGGIQVVQTCELYANIFGLPAAALARVPVRIGSRRELNPDKTLAHLALQRAAYAAAHHVVANSRAAAARLVREGVPPRKIVVIPNGLDEGRFRSGEAHRHRARSAVPRIVTVAKLRTEKAHEVLIGAAARVAATYPAAVFEFAGDGPREERLRQAARAAGVGGRITFLGHRDDVPALLAEADVFVLPSRSEASPNSVIEAMAAGVPVVATTVGGIPELIEHGRSGLLVPPDDPAALAAAIVRLLDCEPEARQFAARARADVVARHSFGRMVAAFEGLYLSALARRARAVPAAAEAAAH